MTDLVHMRHAGFIAAAYALGVLVPLTYAILATQRAGLARRRLAAAEQGRPRLQGVP